MTFRGIPRRTYRVQRATTIINPQWTTLASVTTDASGNGQHLDTAPPPGGAFYRTVSP